MEFKVLEKSVKLLPKYGQPVPETVLRHIRRVDEQDAREQALQREVQAKEAFDNAWVKKMEFELSNMTQASGGSRP